MYPVADPYSPWAPEWRAMRRVTVEERRARLGRRHRLAAEARTDDVVEVARSLVGLHATDPASVFRSAAVRMLDPSVVAVEDALYEQRSLVRMLGMRRTMFVVPDETVPVIQSACTDAIAERERRRLAKDVEAADVAAAGEGEAWLTAAEEAVHAALAARGPAFGAELSADVPALRETYSYGEGKKYATTANFASRILNVMSMHGEIVRGRPRGTWASSQYRWAPVEAWLPHGIVELPRDEARVTLIAAWLRAFGPGTEADVKWWTGLTLGEVRKALAVIEPVEVELEGAAGPGLLLPDDVEPEPTLDPWVALLPPLDPTPMGWTGRDWYLGDHKAPLFDRSGNIGPTVWADGRIVGGWAQRKGGPDDGAIVHRLLEDVGSDALAAIDQAATHLVTFHTSVRPTPRFRTPLERTLTS
jgi:winged helix DNA-binding protein